jgi:hypothetical protein
MFFAFRVFRSGRRRQKKNTRNKSGAEPPHSTVSPPICGGALGCGGLDAAFFLCGRSVLHPTREYEHDNDERKCGHRQAQHDDQKQDGEFERRPAAPPAGSVGVVGPVLIHDANPFGRAGPTHHLERTRTQLSSLMASQWCSHLPFFRRNRQQIHGSPYSSIRKTRDGRLRAINLR